MLVVIFSRIEAFQRGNFRDNHIPKASAAVQFKHFFYGGIFLHIIFVEYG